MKLAGRIKIPEHVLGQRVGDETVLLNTQSGVYYVLDGSGPRLWDLITETGDLARAREGMLDDYEVTESQLDEDLIRLLEELTRLGLVSIEGVDAL